MKGRTMTKYLLTIYQPDGPPPADLDLDKVMAEVGELTQRMQEAGAWVFAAGLHPASTATVVRADKGDFLTTDGPYTESKEHVGGFTVVEAPDLDAALEWGRELAAVLAPLPIEVRPIADE
jgi:hypothetical protein